MFRHLLAVLALAAPLAAFEPNVNADLFDVAEVAGRERRQADTTTSTDAPSDRVEDPVVLNFDNLDYDTTDLSALEANIRAEIEKNGASDFTITLEKGSSSDAVARQVASGIIAKVLFENLADRATIAGLADKIVTAVAKATKGPTNTITIDYDSVDGTTQLTETQLAEIAAVISEAVLNADQLLEADDFVVYFDEVTGNFQARFENGVDPEVAGSALATDSSTLAVKGVDGLADLSASAGTQLIEASGDSSAKVNPVTPFCDANGGVTGKKAKKAKSKSSKRQDKSPAPSGRVSGSGMAPAEQEKQAKAPKKEKEADDVTEEAKISGSGSGPAEAEAKVEAKAEAKVQAKVQAKGKKAKRARREAKGKKAKDVKDVKGDTAESRASGSGAVQAEAKADEVVKAKKAKATKEVVEEEAKESGSGQAAEAKEQGSGVQSSFRGPSSSSSKKSSKKSPKKSGKKSDKRSANCIQQTGGFASSAGTLAGQGTTAAAAFAAVAMVGAAIGAALYVRRTRVSSQVVSETSPLISAEHIGA